jgi:hypothetical protein
MSPQGKRRLQSDFTGVMQGGRMADLATLEEKLAEVTGLAGDRRALQALASWHRWLPA